MKILIGTKNSAKFRDIKEMLEQYGFEVVEIEEVGIGTVEEVGKTFEENAIFKAQTYAKLSGLPTIADDGGLEIEALRGEPGVKSRRGIGNESDEALIEYILNRMEGVKNRAAQLRTVMVLAFPDGTYYTSEACIQGIISEAPSKKRIPGYPYRSIFYIPEFQKFYSELDYTDLRGKEYNHRKRALENLLKNLE